VLSLLIRYHEKVQRLDRTFLTRVSHGRSGSTYWRWALAPPRLEHRLPGFNGVVPKHSSARLGNRVIRWPPMECPQDDPLTMGVRCVS